LPSFMIADHAARPARGIGCNYLTFCLTTPIRCSRCACFSDADTCRPLRVVAMINPHATNMSSALVSRGTAFEIVLDKVHSFERSNIVHLFVFGEIAVHIAGCSHQNGLPGGMGCNHATFDASDASDALAASNSLSRIS